MYRYSLLDKIFKKDSIDESKVLLKLLSYTIRFDIKGIYRYGSVQVKRSSLSLPLEGSTAALNRLSDLAGPVGETYPTRFSYLAERAKHQSKTAMLDGPVRPFIHSKKYKLEGLTDRLSSPSHVGDINQLFSLSVGTTAVLAGPSFMERW